MAEMPDASGRPVRWELVDSRLDQALHRLLEGPGVADNPEGRRQDQGG